MAPPSVPGLAMPLASQGRAAGITAALRAGVLALARAADRLPLSGRARAALYRAAISSHFVAGVRRGLRLYRGPQC